MGKEIEHKYIVVSDAYREAAVRSVLIAQGYLSRNPERTVRVRVKGTKGFLTIKGKTEGISRPEFEYEIPLEDAREMLRMCEKPVIEKVRNLVPFEGKTWEVDEFKGELDGIRVAEIELEDEKETYALPSFIGKEVSGDSRWFNSQIPRYAEELKRICREGEM